MVDEITSMKVTRKLLDELDKIKVHEREPYEDVVWRLLEKVEKK